MRSTRAPLVLDHKGVMRLTPCEDPFENSAWLIKSMNGVATTMDLSIPLTIPIAVTTP